MWHTKAVCCSRNSTFALMSSSDIDGKNGDILFSWGSEKEGVLGLGNIQGIQYFPIKIVIEEGNEDIEIIQLSAGRSHAGVICKRKGDNGPNCVYVWGSNKYG